MFKRLLLKLLGNSIYQQEPYEAKKMQTWLWKCYEDEGFKSYYTMRKKYIVNQMLGKISEEERAENRGRLMELQGLTTNANSEFKKRKLEVKSVKSK